MALLNGMYIHVIDEDFERSVEKSTHSVENGIDITDSVKKNPKELSLSGRIVNYTGYSYDENFEDAHSIRAWISLVKKDGSCFERMSFERLNDELVAFEGGTRWYDTGDIRYVDVDGNPMDISNGNDKDTVTAVFFEVVVPYEGKVRIQNDYVGYCAFNIINKSTTSYNVRDYDADAEELSDLIFSNTYNDERGRIRTEFINYDVVNNEPPVIEVSRSAAWVIEQINMLVETGSVIQYEGRNTLSNYQIKSFKTSHPNKVAGGAEFSMTLEECRTASNSYSADNIENGVGDGGNQQITEGDNSEIWYYVQLGDSIDGILNNDYADLSRPAIDGVEYSIYDWIMKKNPEAFETEGDISTLRAYQNILVGYR